MDAFPPLTPTIVGREMFLLWEWSVTKFLSLLSSLFSVFALRSSLICHVGMVGHTIPLSSLSSKPQADFVLITGRKYKKNLRRSTSYFSGQHQIDCTPRVHASHPAPVADPRARVGGSSAHIYGYISAPHTHDSWQRDVPLVGMVGHKIPLSSLFSLLCLRSSLFSHVGMVGRTIPLSSLLSSLSSKPQADFVLITDSKYQKSLRRSAF